MVWGGVGIPRGRKFLGERGRLEVVVSFWELWSAGNCPRGKSVLARFRVAA